MSALISFSLKRYITGRHTLSLVDSSQPAQPALVLLLAAALGFDLLLARRSGEKEFWSLPRWVQVLLIIVLLVSALSTLFVESTAPFVYQAF